MKKVNLLLLFLLGLASQIVNAQCVNGDCINGQGTWEWESGSTYTGEFQNGTRTGYGQYTFQNGDIYIGEWQNNRRHGYGVYFYNAHSNYKEYAGEWQSGKRHGMGIMYYDDNDTKPRFGVWKNNKYLYKYENIGCLEGDCYKGKGVYVWNDGSRYDGNFKNGERNGEGTYYYPKGAKYVGEQKDGKRNGKGTYYYPSGSKYSGEWKTETRTGEGSMYSKGKLIDKGLWEKGTLISPVQLKEAGLQNESSKPPTITMITPKVIAIDKGGDKIIVKDKTITIEGQVSDNDGVKKVRTNAAISELLDVDNITKRIFGTINLVEGENLLWIEAEDKLGNKVRAEYKIIHNENTAIIATQYGCLSGDCINGFGTWKWENGTMYTGYFEAGSRMGYGVYTFANKDIYIGEWQNNQRHGYGVYYYNAKSEYKQYAGMWKNGQRSGIGKMDYENETITSRFGVWKENTFVGIYEKIGCISGDCNKGKGTYVWNDGSRYEGQFVNGQRAGEGVYYYPKGAKYIGTQKNGKRHGTGTYYYPSGKKYIGEWKEDVKDGQATFYYLSDNTIIITDGIWKNGQQQIETD